MPTMIFRMNAQSALELESIKAEAVALARSTEALSDAEFARVKPVLDRFFRLLARVNTNLVLVDAGRDSEDSPAMGLRVQ